MRSPALLHQPSFDSMLTINQINKIKITIPPHPEPLPPVPPEEDPPPVSLEYLI
jgi:hypothetical protein